MRKRAERNLAAAYRRVSSWVDVDPATGCSISRYSTGSHGYAQAWDGQTVVLAHRVVWEYLHGPIADGQTVDHLCHVRKCVEPAHLRLIPNLDNARRNGPGDWPLDGRCKRGHPAYFWRPKGPIRQKGYCPECRRESALTKKEAN